MFILIFVSKQRVTKVKRFMSMDDLLIFVNKLLNKKMGVPYLALANGLVRVDYKYFMEIYPDKAQRILTIISSYLMGVGIEKEDFYVRNILND